MNPLGEVEKAHWGGREDQSKKIKVILMRVFFLESEGSVHVRVMIDIEGLLC